MPRHLKVNGKKNANVILVKAWIEIPVKKKKDSEQLNSETYLVQTRVADYIVLLEKKINGDLPKLPIKKQK